VFLLVAPTPVPRGERCRRRWTCFDDGPGLAPRMSQAARADKSLGL